MPFLKQVKPLWDRSTLTLAELAERCSVSESSMSRYLNGKVSPPADIAEHILQELSADIVTEAAPEEKPQVAVPTALQIWDVYKDEINTLQANHANHVETIRASHASHVEAIRSNYAAQIADLKKDKLYLFVTMLVLFVLLVYFVLDGLHGNWGIIRYM